MNGTYIFYSAFFLLLLVGCTHEKAENSIVSSSQQNNIICEQCGVKSWVKNYTRTHINGSMETFKLMADELTQQQRKGRIIHFRDYDELSFKGLTINQSLNSEIVMFDMNEFFRPVSVNKVSQSMTLDQTELGHKKENDEIGLYGNHLSRVISDGFNIHFKPPKKEPILLTAEHASMQTETMIIKLEDNVSLKARKCKISTNIALWSNKYNGLFLPEAYVFNEKKYAKPVFFQIKNNGICKRIIPTPLIEYSDRLDQIEQQLLESMPSSLRFVFGLFVPSIPHRFIRKNNYATKSTVTRNRHALAYNI